MDKIKIVGGNVLNGKINISGAKNAALPLVCASLLTADEVTLTLANNQFSIKNGGVTRAKLATAVTDELDSKLEASDIDVQFNDTTGILTISVGETAGE